MYKQTDIKTNKTVKQRMQKLKQSTQYGYLFRNMQKIALKIAGTIPQFFNVGFKMKTLLIYNIFLMSLLALFVSVVKMVVLSKSEWCPLDNAVHSFLLFYITFIFNYPFSQILRRFTNIYAASQLVQFIFHSEQIGFSEGISGLSSALICDSNRSSISKNFIGLFLFSYIMRLFFEL